MSDILVFGNINADPVIRLEKPIGPGIELLGEDLGLRLGGAAANAASALTVAGDRVRLVGFVGSDDTGDRLLQMIADRPGDWDVSGVDRLPGSTPSCLILIDPNGERTIIGLRNPMSPQEWPDPAMDGVACAYVGSRWPVPQRIIDRLADRAIPVVSQFKGEDTVAGAAVVVASHVHFPGPGNGTPWQTLQRLGRTPDWLVVTQGARGAFATDGRSRLEIPAETADLIDTTGAGDAFAAGIVYGTARRWPMEARLALATRWAALAVGHFGSTFPDTAADIARYPSTDRIVTR